jgi:hypothetical protein
MNELTSTKHLNITNIWTPAEWTEEPRDHDYFIEALPTRFARAIWATFITLSVKLAYVYARKTQS